MRDALRIGDWHVDPDVGTLCRGDERFQLEPKAMDVLVYLAEHPGEVQGKERLIRAVWPDTFVTDEVLSNAIWQLRKALGDDSRNPRYIETLPRRGYRLIAPVASGAASPQHAGGPGIRTPIRTPVVLLQTHGSLAGEQLKEESDSGALAEGVPRPARSPTRRLLMFGAAAATVLLTVAAILWYRTAAHAPVARPGLVPLTTFPGNESTPAFSPDGNRIAFTWDGPNEDNSDIYVMLLGAQNPVRLTTDPAPERQPVWSPDGRRIAFLRSGATPSVMVMSALGGSERELARLSRRTRGIDWSPDGKLVAFPADPEGGGPAQIVLLAPDTGERRVATLPPASSNSGDGWPRFSPDGTTLAFLRVVDPSHERIGVVPVNGPAGPGRLVTPAALRAATFAWTRDSRELVFGGREGTAIGMWRMAVDGRTRPVQVAEAGREAVQPAISPRGDLLAFTKGRYLDMDIWRLELKNGHAASDPIRTVASTALDAAPDYSPDGKRIVFGSDRSGTYEIWVCNADGTNPTRVTTLNAPMTGAPRWSPDGRTIAFDSTLGGDSEIYTVSADGGPAKRLTNHPGSDIVATWSRDGRWIYFTSDRTGSRQLWRMPAGGGEPVQLTKHGGVNATESGDRTTLYYLKDIEAPGLWRMPIGGGDEVLVNDAPEAGRWGQIALAESGFYYVGPNGTDSPARYAIFFCRFGVRNMTRVARLALRPSADLPGLSLAPDGKTILFAQGKASGSDLMLLENFR